MRAFISCVMCVIATKCIKRRTYLIMTHLQNKLDNVLVTLDLLVFDGLPYDDVHVKAFRDKRE